jgi:hypothetical protein
MSFMMEFLDLLFQWIAQGIACAYIVMALVSVVVLLIVAAHPVWMPILIAGENAAEFLGGICKRFAEWWEDRRARRRSGGSSL